MENLASIVATLATIAAACLTASNLGSRITGYGFIVFTVGSIAWLTLGLLTDQPALVWTNIAMTLLNMFGVWRWLGRQASVEDAASNAAQHSRALASETLFPASLLTKAKLVGADGEPLGTAVDAMLGCRSGVPAYVVVADGGVAGVGETLRRLDWEKARFDGDTVVTALDRRGFEALESLPKDEWPGR